MTAQYTEDALVEQSALDFLGDLGWETTTMRRMCDLLLLRLVSGEVDVSGVEVEEIGL